MVDIIIDFSIDLDNRTQVFKMIAHLYLLLSSVSQYYSIRSFMIICNHAIIIHWLTYFHPLYTDSDTLTVACITIHQ